MTFGRSFFRRKKRRNEEDDDEILQPSLLGQLVDESYSGESEESTSSRVWDEVNRSKVSK